MELLIAANSVPLAQADTVPASGTPQYATDGNPAAGVAPTDAPAWHYNMVMAELVALVTAAGLATSGATWTQIAQAVGIIGKRVEVFASSGNFVVPANVFYLYAQVWGEGGGGATSSSAGMPGGGGGGAGYTEGGFAVSPGQSFPVTVFTGVPGETAGRNCSFGPLTAGGGGAGGLGTNSAVGPGGTGGVATGGTLVINGSGGSNGIVYAPNANVEGGMGGTAAFAPGPSRAVGTASSGFNGNSGAFPGGGSTGCTLSTATSGGGLVVIRY